MSLIGRVYQTLYHTTPEIWVTVAQIRLGMRSGPLYPVPPTPPPVPEPPALDGEPVEPNRLIQPLDDTYYDRAHLFTQWVMESIRQGADLYKVLRGFDGRQFWDGLVEYAYFVHWLGGGSQKDGQKDDWLDVGLTVNHKLLFNTLKDRCAGLWLYVGAPILEKEFIIKNAIYYHFDPPERAFPDGRQFKYVVSLSGLAHVGIDRLNYYFFDDSAEEEDDEQLHKVRQRLRRNQEYKDWERLKKRYAERVRALGRYAVIPEIYELPTAIPLVRVIRKLAQVTAPGGRLLVSVPYGYPELVADPETGEVIFQVFDYAAVQEACQTVQAEGLKTKLDILAATEKGWIPVEDPESCRPRYANGTPRAGAMAFITGRRE